MLFPVGCRLPSHAMGQLLCQLLLSTAFLGKCAFPVRQTYDCHPRNNSSLSWLFYLYFIAVFVHVAKFLIKSFLKPHCNLPFSILSILSAIGQFPVSLSFKHRYISYDEHLHLYILFLRSPKVELVGMTVLKLLL